MVGADPETTSFMELERDAGGYGEPMAWGVEWLNRCSLTLVTPRFLVGRFWVGYWSWIVRMCGWFHRGFSLFQVQLLLRWDGDVWEAKTNKVEFKTGWRPLLCISQKRFNQLYQCRSKEIFNKIFLTHCKSSLEMHLWYKCLMLAVFYI